MSGEGTIGLRQYGEHFDDVQSDLSGFGSLGGNAIHQHNKATAKQTSEGVELHANCDNCGVHNKILADWTEIIILSVGRIPPQGWKYDRGHIRTDVACRGCRRLLPVGVIPEECKRWVMAAINARQLDPQVAEQIAQKARAMR